MDSFDRLIEEIDIPCPLIDIPFQFKCISMENFLKVPIPL
jgi:hypothetical protein